MSQHSFGLHHWHRRKRVHQKLEQYPHPQAFKRTLDYAIYAVGIIGPIMTLDQVNQIWLHHNATGVSFITWGTYVITSSFWLLYGISHRERPIIFTYAIWIVLDSLVAIGVLLYS